jgi:predicted dehydrogenase
MAAHAIPALADWRDLLGKVDLVSVCSPARRMRRSCAPFSNAGAHVLVEKPIATDLDEADELIALAEASGRVLTVGHQERFVFARTGMLDYRDAPLEVECWRTGPWTGRGDDVSVVLDLMIHDLDLVHRLIPATSRRPGARHREPQPACGRCERACHFRKRRAGAAACEPRVARRAVAACARSMPMASSKSIS